MSAAENWIPDVRGKQAMHELAMATFAALEEADLQDALDALHERVLAQGTAIFEVSYPGGVCHWNFKPMVELVLRHTLHTAARVDLPPDERRLEIAAALHLAGF